MAIKHLLFLLLGIAALSTQSCDKDKSDSVRTTEEKIRGIWQIDHIAVNEHFNGVDKTTTFTGEPSDFVNFTSDGKMYTSFGGNVDTSDYKVQSDTRLIIDGDGASIKKLSDNLFTFYSKDETGSIGYVEVTYNLKR